MDETQKDAQHWNTLKGLFSIAVELPPPEREAYLDSLDQPPEILAELAHLLAADGAPGTLDEPLVRRKDASGRELRDLEGSTVACYRIQHRVGSGGMGAVYLAEREEQGVVQRAALKVLARGMTSRAALERFHRERQILARLDHPGICRLIDTGVTDDGRPYLVMPFLDSAAALTDHAQRRGLGIRERVALFIQVCDAVHYAHQNLVVHSDLKPGNILVLPSGHVQLVDFGVSRLLTPEQADLTQELGEGRPLTPDYASPEQLIGRSPTTASDVYALGVLLFELLTGAKPYRVATDRPPAAWVASIRMPARSDAPGIPTDLYTICVKAMAPEPAGRYGSCMALAEDLDRWCRGNPVHARAPSLSYRLSRFVSRHRWPVAAAAIGALAVLVLAVVTTISAATLAVQAERLVEARDRAEATAQFWAHLFEQTDPAAAPQASESVDELLARAIERLEQSDELAPSARIRLLAVISTAYWHRARPEQALEAALAAAAVADEQRVAPSARVTAYKQLANIRQSRGELAEARWAIDESLAALARVPAPSKILRAQVFNADALILDLEGDTDAAAERLEQVVALQRALPLADVRVDHATALGNLAYMHFRLARGEPDPELRLTRASVLVERSIALLREGFGPAHPRVAFMLNAAGVIHREKGDLRRALDAFEHAREIADSRLPEGHEMLTHLRQNLGDLRRRMGDLAGAAAAYEAAFELAEVPHGHPDIRTSFVGLGQTLFELGAWARLATAVEAMAHHLEALPPQGGTRLWWEVMDAAAELKGAPPAPAQLAEWRSRAERLSDTGLAALLERYDAATQ